MSVMIRLSDRKPAAEGGRRLVFVHPDDPKLIIKVMKPSYMAQNWSAPLTIRQKTKRYKQHTYLFMEVREHLAACAKNGHPPKHLQNIVGFADTDLGLGLVYEAILGPDGKFAPTLQDFIDRGQYTPEIQKAFLEFRDWFVDAPIVTTPLHPDNMVLNRDETGKPYFVLIDGIGEKTVIPIKGWLQALNRRHKLKDLKRFDRKEGVPAEPQTA